MTLTKEQFLQLGKCKSEVIHLSSIDADIEIKQLSAADQEAWILDKDNSFTKLISLCLVNPKLSINEVKCLNLEVVKELQEKCIEINKLDSDKKKS